MDKRTFHCLCFFISWEGSWGRCWMLKKRSYEIVGLKAKAGIGDRNVILLGFFESPPNVDIHELIMIA